VAESTGAVAELAAVDGCPKRQAEAALAAARREGNRQAEATALVDLGLIASDSSPPAPHGAALLEEALKLARELPNWPLQADILISLGRASILANEPRTAAPQLEEALAIARELGDRYLEKLALERLGHAYRRLGDGPRCLAAWHEAVTLAREVGDRLHEATVLWLLAIAYAELGERVQAIASAEAAVQILERAGNPQAPWYAEHLRRFRTSGTSGELVGRSVGVDAMLFGDIVVAAGTARPAAERASPSSGQGPGLLRMALTATQAMAQFLGSGLKIVSRPEREERLRICSACPHHTGLRCRLCGCFTNTKARLPYEECPIRKW
jgi:tetratricopeptide (TPR) repeat protein